MTDFSHLSSTQRKTAEIVLKTKDWLESQDETVDAASMRRASAQFRENGLSRALLYSPPYRSIWDDAEQGTSSSNHRKVKRIAAENDKLKDDLGKARGALEKAKAVAEERDETIRALREQIAGLEAEKQDLLQGFVDH